jgi:hypothetical protein
VGPLFGNPAAVGVVIAALDALVVPDARNEVVPDSFVGG